MGFAGMGRLAERLEMQAKGGRLADPEALTLALEGKFRRVSLFGERFRPGA
jgi:hypothetical protein